MTIAGLVTVIIVSVVDVLLVVKAVRARDWRWNAAVTVLAGGVWVYAVFWLRNQTAGLFTGAVTLIWASLTWAERRDRKNR